MKYLLFFHLKFFYIENYSYLYDDKIENMNQDEAKAYENQGLKEQRENFLLDALEYYTTHPNSRNVSTTGACRYSPKNANPNSEGCIIGRKMTPEQQIKADSYPVTGISRIIEECRKGVPLLNEELLNLSEGFLATCQGFHDTKPHWRNKNLELTEKGNQYLRQIIADFDLDQTKFLKFL